MSGPHLGARVTPLVDGRLAADAAARAQDHVRSCGECAEAVETERLAGTTPSPATEIDDRLFDPDVQRALDSLSPEFRAAVVLCDIEGLSYEEIAATLGIKLGTVRSRIHRGRAHIRAALENAR